MIRWTALLALALSACSSAEQQPERKWDVKVRTTGGESKVWVYKLDGSVQCAKNEKVLTPPAATQQLKSAGIMVFQGRSGHDGLMRTAVCGAGTGNTVELEIAATDLPKAQAQGFKKLPPQN